MFDHQNLKGGDAAIHHFVQRRARAPVDQTDRKMTEQVDDMRADALFDDAGQLRPHAGKHGGGGKQAKNLGRAFRMHAGRCSGPEVRQNSGIPVP